MVGQHREHVGHLVRAVGEHLLAVGIAPDVTFATTFRGLATRLALTISVRIDAQVTILSLSANLFRTQLLSPSLTSGTRPEASEIPRSRSAVFGQRGREAHALSCN